MNVDKCSKENTKDVILKAVLFLDQNFTIIGGSRRVTHLNLVKLSSAFPNNKTAKGQIRRLV